MNIQNLKKSKKGFTLVEIIVVLVIIAILAAIAIPAMTGWIDKANEKAIYAEARTALLAAQTIASEEYANDTDFDTVTGVSNAALSGLTASDIGDATVLNGVVTDLTYTAGDYTATYEDGTWTIE